MSAGENKYGSAKACQWLGFGLLIARSFTGWWLAVGVVHTSRGWLFAGGQPSASCTMPPLCRRQELMRRKVIELCELGHWL